MAYTITIQGDTELAAKLRKFGVAVLDLSKGMDDVGIYLTRFFSGEVFASRGGAIGEPWTPLNDRYAAFKAEVWPGRPPLVKTGLMQRSFEHETTKLSARVFNDVSYFGYHQDGRGVPERIMMKVDEQRERVIVGLISDDIDSKMRAADV